MGWDGTVALRFAAVHFRGKAKLDEVSQRTITLEKDLQEASVNGARSQLCRRTADVLHTLSRCLRRVQSVIWFLHLADAG